MVMAGTYGMTPGGGRAGVRDPWTGASGQRGVGNAGSLSGFGGFGDFGGGASAGLPGFDGGSSRGGTIAGRATGGRGGGGLPQLPYKPEAPRARGMVDELADAGTGLLDPNSAYSRRLRNEISEDIGQRTQAQQRGAALRAARSGLGVGASPELLETQGEIGREGLRATGDATADAMLGGIGLGGRLLSPALSGEIGLQGQNLQGYLQQQQLQQGAERDQLQAALQAQRLGQETYLRELALMGSGFGF